jgi:nucleotide-binding universal stress UspA family protein
MLKVRTILHPTDFSPSSRHALPHALLLARHFGAELHLLHAVVWRGEDPDPERAFPEPQEILTGMFDAAESKMAELLAPHRDEPLRIREVRERGIYAGPVILDYAREHDVDLIVIGTHGRRGPQRLLLGSVAEEVVRHARCPVLTVHTRDEAPGTAALDRLLLPFDFSAHSRTALAYARELAKTYGAALDLLHVVETHAYPTFYGNLGAEPVLERMDELRRRAAAEMEQVYADTRGPDVPHGFFVADGRPSSEIVRFAEEHGSGLIVVATHGLSGLERLLLGSTAEAVVRSAHCPVFTVKAFGKSLIAG